MKVVLGIIFMLLLLGVLIHELTYEKFETGLEAVLVVGVTIIGIYITGSFIANDLKK